MSETCECVVIGAGVVGLAVARALAAAGREVVVVEAAGEIGSGTSSRNSEVIHAALYYPQGSLKARLCRRGRDLLYAYLTERGIEYLRCEKLVVATSAEEIAVLRNIEDRARANGVEDLRWLAADEAVAMEPEVACVAALLSPSTGIFDSHAYMLSLQGDAEAAGAVFAFNAPVVGGAIVSAGDGNPIRLDVGGTAPASLSCRIVVNAAGLGAQQVASAMGLPSTLVPPLFYAKGSYFSYFGRPPFQRLVYPVPDEASVGLHYTRDLAGQGRFGPDVEWVEAINYDVDGARAQQFYAAIRRFWPGLPDNALQPGYAGIRPKLQRPGTPPLDFSIQGPQTHGIAGLVNLFGIESPGLTSSLALAEEVVARLR
ncbi:MAG: NAD(P)/FAD-dependent oxidoreductase [Rhodospirillales bacterium]